MDPPSNTHNCIAYAAWDTNQWWAHTPDRYWPPHATRSNSIASLRQAFAGLGYEECEDGSVEPGYHKIAFKRTKAHGSTRAFKRPTECGAAKWAEGR